MGDEKKIIRYRRDLYQLFEAPVLAAEIGVAEGNFSNEMLEWKLPDGTEAISGLYMVDRWKQVQGQKGDGSNSQTWHDANLRQVITRTKKYGDRATILRGDSMVMAGKVADESLGLVYIDGDHSYEGVMRDIYAWMPKIGWGGYMAFHDYENPAYGVNRAVKEFCNGRFEIQSLPEDKMWDAGAYFQLC